MGGGGGGEGVGCTIYVGLPINLSKEKPLLSTAPHKSRRSCIRPDKYLRPARTHKSVGVKSRISDHRNLE